MLKAKMSENFPSKNFPPNVDHLGGLEALEIKGYEK